MNVLGTDVARYQNPYALPWREWVAGGLTCGIAQITHGIGPEPCAEEHLQAMKAAAVPVIGAYHYLMPGNAALQLLSFFQHLERAYEFAALDVEEPGLTGDDVVTWCRLYDADCQLPLYLYGNNALAAIVAAHPELKRYGVWWANYPANKARISSPPENTHASAPAGLRLAGWQFTGTGRLSPYAGDIDLTQWFELPSGEKPVTVPIIAKGPKLGIHSIQPGNTLALAQKALDHGWHWPLVKVLHDASVAADVKRISPETLTIVRYMPPSVDDEGLQNVPNWTPDQMAAWAKRLIDNYFARTAAAHLPFVDYLDPTNEPDPPENEGVSPAARLAARAYLFPAGAEAYGQLGLAFCELVRQADERGVHLSIPAFPQGVPEYDEMIALVDTGLFGLMQKGGHIFDVHEGVFTDQAIDFGYGDIIPGAPHIQGAGSTNFRHRYLYSLLEKRGEVVPLVVSEFYGGGRYSNSPADQLARFAWYDQRARAEPYLLAFCPFTINADGGWANADYGPTYDSPELWQWIDAEKDKPNGDDEMQPLYHARPLQDLLLRDAQGQPVTDPIAPSGAVLKGTLVHVYKENVTAGAYSNRVQVTPDGKNIWGIATALQRA